MDEFMFVLLLEQKASHSYSISISNSLHKLQDYKQLSTMKLKHDVLCLRGLITCRSSFKLRVVSEENVTVFAPLHGSAS